MDSVGAYEDVSRFEGLNARFRGVVDRLLDLDMQVGLEPGPQLHFARRLHAAWSELKDPVHARTVGALWDALDRFDAEVELAVGALDELEARLRATAPAF